MARVAGDLLDYVIMWAWGTTTLLVVSVVWTAAALWRRPLAWRWRASPGWVALATILLATSTAFVWDAAYTSPPQPITQSETVRGVAPATIQALRSASTPGGGPDGHYLMSWHEDAHSVGMSGFGLYLALDRAGFDVGVPGHLAVEAGGRHRVITPDEATATIHLVIGEAAIDRWRAVPEAANVAYHDPRTSEELDEYRQLYAEVTAGLRAADREDLVELLDLSLILAALGGPPEDLLPKIMRLMELGLPAAVFVAPVDVLPAA
jgi:hypothetical protein